MFSRLCNLILGALTLAACVPLTAHSATFHVLPDGSGDFPTIQAAVQASTNGDTILLGDGTFTGPGNYDIDLQSKALVIRSEGESPDACVLDPGLYGRAFLIEDVTGGEVRIGSVSIQNGMKYAEEGGGALCVGSRVRFENCIFDRCHAVAGAAVSAISCSMTLDRCRFHMNITVIASGEEFHGGAVSASACDLDVSDCVFEANFAPYGGGFYLNYSSRLRLSGCVFLFSAAGEGGGLCCRDSTVDVFSSTLYHSWVYLMQNSTLTMDRSIVVESPAQNAAIECEGTGSSAFLTCCNLHGNGGGDWVGCIESQFGENGNISADPLFCYVPDLDLTLQADSPCAPENNPNCGLIGALPVGCGPTPVVSTTWGACKLRFLEETPARTMWPQPSGKMRP